MEKRVLRFAQDDKIWSWDDGILSQALEGNSRFPSGMTERKAKAGPSLRSG
jgi:hypothetical protein